MATDKLLWGFSRPLFRIGTSRYVLNQPTSEHDEKFPKRIILNESSLTGYLNEHKIGNRGIFTLVYDMLDRPSCETLIDIFNSASDIYMRPHFNFWKEYLIRCVNGWELDRMGKVNKPYKGTLIFETIALESAIPDESSGSFNFNGSNYIKKDNHSYTGDCSLEFWLKTPVDIPSSDQKICTTDGGVIEWYFYYCTDKRLKFVTYDLGGPPHQDDLYSDITLDLDTWYWVSIRRVSTDAKRIVVDGTRVGLASDGFAANDATDVEIGDTGNGFEGLIQMFRFYSGSLYQDFEEHMIEAIPSGMISALKIWWDFSQGSENDLTANNNDGTIGGAEQYYEESFPDKHYKILV